MKALPIIKQDNLFYFFDERLRELRNCYNSYDRMDLNVFEIAHYKEIINGKKDKWIEVIPFEIFKQN